MSLQPCDVLAWKRLLDQILWLSRHILSAVEIKVSDNVAVYSDLRHGYYCKGRCRQSCIRITACQMGLGVLQNTTTKNCHRNKRKCILPSMARNSARLLMIRILTNSKIWNSSRHQQASGNLVKKKRTAAVPYSAAADSRR